MSYSCVSFASIIPFQLKGNTHTEERGVGITVRVRRARCDPLSSPRVHRRLISFIPSASSSCFVCEDECVTHSVNDDSFISRVLFPSHPWFLSSLACSGALSSMPSLCSVLFDLFELARRCSSSRMSKIVLPATGRSSVSLLCHPNPLSTRERLKVM